MEGWDGVGRPTMGLPTHPCEHCCRLQHREHRFPALVALAAARAVASLLQIIDGKDPEANRDAVIEGDPDAAVSDSSTDLIKMRCAPAHHDAKADHRVDATGPGQGVGDHGQLKGAGDPHDLDVRVADTNLPGGLDRTVDENVSDVGVPAGRDNRDTDPLAVNDSSLRSAGPAHRRLTRG